MAIRSINKKLQLLLVFALISLQDLEAENLMETIRTEKSCSQKEFNPLFRTWRFSLDPKVLSIPTHYDKIKIYIKTENKAPTLAGYYLLNMKFQAAKHCQWHDDWSKGIMDAIQSCLEEHNYKHKENTSIYLSVHMEKDGITSYYNAYVTVK